MLNIVLVEPEIPNNTGNIGRLCVGTESKLHLVHPFGFVINDKNLKRSGLDYWVHLDVTEYENVDEWVKHIPDTSRVFLMSSHAQKSYLETEFQDGDWLVFGIISPVPLAVSQSCLYAGFPCSFSPFYPLCLR